MERIGFFSRLMIDGIRFKVCGLTSLVDAEFADRCGADYLGFNLYPKSPRFVSLEQYKAMAPRLPERKHVAVMVAPTTAELSAAEGAGFDFLQIHFPMETALDAVAGWSTLVGADRLWLAPKLPPGEDVPAQLLLLARFFLFDTFHAGGFGGSGLTGDWGKFARYQTAHPQQTWVLAGGLNPDNIDAALRTSGARYVDVNSGVESAPGVKDEEKLKRFVIRMHESRVAAGKHEVPFRRTPIE